MKGLFSITDLTREQCDSLIEQSLELKKQTNATKPLAGKLLANLFFENSTRTRESHRLAAINLGMDVIGFAGVEGTSVKKGEPLADTTQMYAGYGASLIVARHPLAGSQRYMALACPQATVVNAGDGPNTHPTQTMLDLLTIKEALGKLDDITIALVGDLKFGRTVHSLLQAAELYNITVLLVAPPELAMPVWRVKKYEERAGKRTQQVSFQEALERADVLYMTRIQKERFEKTPEGEEKYERLKSAFKLTKEKAQQTKAIIMHPLPRYKYELEITRDLDNLQNAVYFEQARNGLFMRQAIFLQLHEGKLTPKRVPEPSQTPCPNAKCISNPEHFEHVTLFKSGNECFYCEHPLD